MSNKDDICQGKTISGVLLEEENLAFQIKEIHNAAQKYKIILLQPVLKDF